MGAVSIRGRKLAFGALLLLVGGATWILNSPSLFYEPLLPLPRIAIPVLLAGGLVGGLLRWKLLLYVGWIGIALFMLIVLGTAVPDEDYTFGGPNSPNIVSGGYALGRFLLLLAVGVSLMFCFRMIGKMLRTRDDVADGGDQQSTEK